MVGDHLDNLLTSHDLVIILLTDWYFADWHFICIDLKSLESILMLILTYLQNVDKLPSLEITFLETAI